MRRLFYVAALCSCGGTPTLTVGEFTQEAMGAYCVALHDCDGSNYDACMSTGAATVGAQWNDTTPSKCTETDATQCRSDMHLQSCTATQAGALSSSCTACLSE